MPDQVVTRFAPSPTGALHVGGARTALFNWAFARQHGGRLILRMEDTDQSRSTPEATRSIIRDLRWLGIDWDDGPACPGHWGETENQRFDPYKNQTGRHGPYFQSQRLEIYNQHIDRLVESDLAYHPPDEPEIVRFRMGQNVNFEDAVYGSIKVAAKELNDFVIQKSDGFPTFHLAVVVDDALMNVTHVIRGQEHLSNTPRHVALADALGFSRPAYAHLPSIMNPDGSKMSKRDKAKAARQAARKHPDQDELIERVLDQHEATRNLAPGAIRRLTRSQIEQFIAGQNDDPDLAALMAQFLSTPLPEIDLSDFRRSGYLPQVICNYLCLLGWNPGNDLEKFDNAFLGEHFSLERINKANARFDRDKLFRFDADAIAVLEPDRFSGLLAEFGSLYHPAAIESLGGRDSKRFKLFTEAYHPRSRTLEEPFAIGRFFLNFDALTDYDLKSIEKVLLKSDQAGLNVLVQIRESLCRSDHWSPQALDDLIGGFAESHGLKVGKVAQPLRVAISGSTISPPIGQTLAILSKEEVLRRIDACTARARAT